jgi:hypothetical protein
MAMARWARSLVMVAAGLLVWLAAGRAFAAAPLCDDRGAIMLAPAPVLDTPVASVDVGDTFDCKDQHAFDTSCRQGRSSSDPFPSPRQFEAVLRSPLPVLGPAVLPARLFRSPPESRAGVRYRVERPPR